MAKHQQRSDEDKKRKRRFILVFLLFLLCLLLFLLILRIYYTTQRLSAPPRSLPAFTPRLPEPLPPPAPPAKHRMAKKTAAPSVLSLVLPFSDGTANFVSIQMIRGTPYIAYVDFSNGYLLRIIRYINNNWEIVGGPIMSQGEAYYVSLQPFKDQLYLAFIDRGDQYRINVLRQVDNGWQPLGHLNAADSAVEGFSLSLLNGTPALSFVDPLGRLMVKWYQAGRWNQLGDGTVGQPGSTQPILIGDATTPVLSWLNARLNYQARIARWQNGRWQSQTMNATSKVNYLQVQPAGEGFYMGYVVYGDYQNQNKPAILQWTKKGWSTIGSSTDFPGEARKLKLVVYNGMPTIAYIDQSQGQRVVVMRYNGKSWQQLRNDGFPNRGFTQISLSVQNGVAYVASVDPDHLNHALVVSFN